MAQRLNGSPAMFKAAQLERTARALEAEAAEAKATMAARRDQVETPLQRANRLALDAAEARQAADKARRNAVARLLWLIVRLAFLAFLLWGFYRVGFVTGHLT